MVNPARQFYPTTAHVVQEDMSPRDATLLNQAIQATEEQREQQRIENQLNLAELLAKSGIFGKEEDKFRAFAKIQIGKELGLEAAESMQAVYFDHNGPGISVHTRVALALRDGRYRFDIQRLDRDGCEIQWYRKRGKEWQELPVLRCIADELKGTMIHERGQQKELLEKWNYKSWREDMLYAFVQRRAIRRYAPETQGSWALPPEDDEAMEDATLDETQATTQEEREAHVVDLFDKAEEIVTGVQQPRPSVAETKRQTELRTRMLDEIHALLASLPPDLDREGVIAQTFPAPISTMGALASVHLDDLRTGLSSLRAGVAALYPSAPPEHSSAAPVADGAPPEAAAQGAEVTVEATLTPTERLKDLVQTHINPLDDSKRREALKKAIASVLYGVAGWPQVHKLSEAQLDAELGMVQWLCTRLESQGLPSAEQYPDLADWVRHEQQSRTAMQAPPEQESLV